jgi:hypothetical protein
MFAVGHLALGYLTGKTTSKLLSLDVNIPLLFIASVIPDIDLVIPGLKHRGPAHSIILLTLLLIPAFIRYRRNAISYSIALLTHPLIGDSLTGSQGTQLLWPITTNWYGLEIHPETLASVTLEWLLFLGCITLMLTTKDLHRLFQKHQSNLLLTIPIATVLLPTVFTIPLYVPLALLIPHITYLTIFTVSIFVELKARSKQS